MMQTLGRRDVRRINQRYDRTVTLWEGQFKSSYPRQAQGLSDDWLVDHDDHVALGQNAASRQTAYQA